MMVLPTDGTMRKLLAKIPDNLLYLVCAVAAFSLVFPGPGSGLGWIVSPVLAFMVFNVSMTISLRDLLQVVKHPFVILWGIFLSFIVMALFSLVLGKFFLPAFPTLSTGQLLLGCLPADISAPLMVYLIGGDTALATAMLVIEMMLTPFVLPNVLTVLGGITLAVPASYLVVELICIIIIPLAIGVFLNSCSGEVGEKKDIWSGIASLCYILLLFVVVSVNAQTILSLKAIAVIVIFMEISLNLFGYGLAYGTKIIFSLKKEIFTPLLFIAGTKEFGIAPAVVDIMNGNQAIVIPSALYAVVQMISSPVMVKAGKWLKS
jgi:bile acid:Na+ symporter, BASS family